MAPRWTDDMNIKFVLLYQDHECLWNQFHELYKNKYSRESALQNIVIAMNIEGFGVAEAKNKIKALRATYQSEITKVKQSEKSGSGSGDIYAPTLKWFNIMKEIMIKGTLKRKTTSNLESPKIIPCKKQAMNETTINEDQDSTIIDATLSDIGEEEDLEESLIDNVTNEEPLEVSSTKVNRPPLDKQQDVIPKKVRNRSKIQQIAATARELKQLSQNISKSDNNKPSEDNEFDVFGKHVASQLKQLTAEHAITAIGEINTILTNKRLASLLGVAVAPNTNESSQTSPIYIITENVGNYSQEVGIPCTSSNEDAST